MDIHTEEPHGNNNDASQVDLKPRIGMIFSSDDEEYAFYNQYARAVGFSIRRDTVHNDENDKTIVKSRRFTCSKGGTKVEDKRDWKVKKTRRETRCECEAKMCITRLPSGEYLCRDFVEGHNHDRHTATTRHLMRSQRCISDLQAFEIDLADHSGIRPKTTYNYMGKQARGIENLGYTHQDLKNYLRSKRQQSLAYGEAGGLSAYFEKQSMLNPSFTYRMQYDMDELVTNIFWADPRMLIDYSLFGDVVIFDTTFCTNKENIPLGVFMGFNHHKGATIFGAALLYIETVESFMWLFETFLEAHGQKKPKIIFTDQDAAMAKVIAQVLPGTWHGLCTWHIRKNGMTHYGYLMKEKGMSFFSKIGRYMYDCDDEDEFEEAWQKLYNHETLHDKSWLDRIYKVKEKWAICFMKHTATLGVKSTQLCESFNSDLKDYLRRSMDLLQFFTHFERVVEIKQDNELKAEFDARNTVPSFVSVLSLILQHAGRVYTPFIYEEFLKEFFWIGYCFVKHRNEVEQESQYVVCVTNAEGQSVGREYCVVYRKVGPMIACSCRYFETVGILCCHALKIFDMLDIKRIPETYILTRWTRTVRSMVVEDVMGKQVIEDLQMDQTQRYRYLCRGRPSGGPSVWEIKYLSPL